MSKQKLEMMIFWKYKILWYFISDDFNKCVLENNGGCFCFKLCIYKVGHLVIAALNNLSTTKSEEAYKKTMKILSDWDRECVEKLVNNDVLD